MSPEEKIKNIIGLNAMNYLPYFLIILVLTLFFFYLGDKLTLNERNCTTLRDLYTSYPNIKSIDYNNDYFDNNLRDFYIKASYNSCCSGGVKNDYVNVCALENVLKNGARFLDFEIYAKNDMPIIGASSSNDYSYKETYNELAFKTAMEKVKDVAFSSICPNPEDPIILHFRIKSEKSSICDEMAKDINHTFGQDHLDKLYSYEYRGKNLGEVKLKDLKKKVIIIVDKSEGIKFKSTKLYEFVNMCSGSEYLRKYRNNDIEHTIDTDEIIKFNKMNMSIVLPDVNVKTDNYSYIHAKETGVQIMAMNFQNFDSNLKFYSLFFDGTQSAFILKPEDMRADTITPTTPDETPQLPSPDQSYGCPADQNACEITSDESDYHEDDDNDGKTGDKWNDDVNTGKWKKIYSLKKIKNLKGKDIDDMGRFLELNGIIHNNGIYKWTGDVTEKNRGRKHYVKKCNDFDGIPGITYFDEDIWKNLYNFYYPPNIDRGVFKEYYAKAMDEKNPKDKREMIKSYDYNETKEDFFKTYAEEYCNKAIYKDNDGEERKCTYKGVVNKGKFNGNLIQGALNKAFEWLHNINSDNKVAFWVVKCKKRD